LGSTRKELLAIWLDMQETFYQRNKTSNHVENSKKADGFEGASNYDYLEYLLTEGVNKGATRCKVINRMAIMERAWFDFKKQEIPIELDTQGIVSISRKTAMSLHSECIKELNRYTVTHFQTELGTLLAFLDGVELLHISKVNKPTSLTDYDQYLKRNTHLIMGGINVSPKLIKKSLDIKSVSSLVVDNTIGIKEQIIYDTQNKYVTGKHIYLMIMCSKGKSKTIGLKTYRSRSGFSGKTGNTTKWSTEVVKKFKQTCEMI
jgi:hypothetical protein